MPFSTTRVPYYDVLGGARVGGGEWWCEQRMENEATGQGWGMAREACKGGPQVVDNNYNSTKYIFKLFTYKKIFDIIFVIWQWIIYFYFT